MNRDELHARARRHRLAQAESELVEQSGAAPVTRDEIAQALGLVGVEKGSTLLVHCSLSALGWVNGGAQVVIETLLASVGVDGTLVMPTHSTQLTDPGTWAQPAVPERWHDRVRATMPAWDRHLTPTRWMGQVAELFRLQPGVLRSDHPHASFAAAGRNARWVTELHPLSDSLGDESPLGRLYEANAHILLLGVGFENNTALHLAESRAQWPGRQTFVTGAPMKGADGRVAWNEFMDQEYNSADFADVGRSFECSSVDAVCTARVGSAQLRLMEVRRLVDFSVAWFEQARLFDMNG
jgi:aminoglycoside 3-N-acetyltransferase